MAGRERPPKEALGKLGWRQVPPTTPLTVFFRYQRGSWTGTAKALARRPDRQAALAESRCSTWPADGGRRNRWLGVRIVRQRWSIWRARVLSARPGRLRRALCHGQGR